MLFEPEEEITGTAELLYRVDALRFARERLGFSPDAKQAAVMSGKIRRGLFINLLLDLQGRAILRVV